MTETRFASVSHWANRLAVLGLLALVLSGCLEVDLPDRYPKPTLENTVPLEITYIRIGEDQYATNAPIYQYTGHVAFGHCLRNPNSYIIAQNGYEVYQILGPPHPSGWRLVARHDTGALPFDGGRSTVMASQAHPVLVNETFEGNSTDYVIHIWNQILIPEPIHRQDRWFNMTFIPYHPGFTVHEEGTPC